MYVNNRRVSDPQTRLVRDQSIGGRLSCFAAAPGNFIL
jgi:hypothetical protein